MAKNFEYHSGKIGSLVKVIVSSIKNNPAALDDIELLRAMVHGAIPELRDRSKCANCGASMKEYVFTFDSLGAILLLRMGAVVRDRLQNGMDFTKANQVRIPELDASHAVKCRTTQASKLGLIAQLRGKNKRRVPGTWVVTRRGWDALAGKSVPKMVKVWRKHIEEHYDDVTTLGEALRWHINYVEKCARKGKAIRGEDYTGLAKSYDQTDWYDFSFHTGALL